MTDNSRFQFHTSHHKVKAFGDWLKQKYREHVTSDGDKAVWDRYIREGWKKGAGRSFDDVRGSERFKTLTKLDEDLGKPKVQDFYKGNREEFLKSSFSQPVAREKVELLAGRTFDELENVSEDMGNKCLPGDTLVNAAVVRTIFRRWYDGPMVEVETRNGRKFSATPNHPMLTVMGWVAAGKLSVGDDLVGQRIGQDPVALGFGGNPNVQHSPTSISKIFDAVAAVGVVERKSGTNVDFHGDGMESEVDVLSPDGLLRIGDFTPIRKHLSECVFSPSYAESGAGFCSVCGYLLTLDQSVDLNARADSDSSNSQSPVDDSSVHAEVFCQRHHRLSSFIPSHDFVSVDVCPKGMVGSTIVPSNSLSLGVGAKYTSFTTTGSNPGDTTPCDRRHLLQCHAGFVESNGFQSLSDRDSGVTPGSNDAGFTADFVNPPLAEASSLSDLETGHAGQIEADRIVSLRVIRFTGHVYNLETVDGYYVIESLYTGNCSRILTDAMVEGKSPRDVARDMAKEVDIGRNRALVISRSEIIRSHAEGQLLALENMGVEEIGVAVEFSTSGKGNVCEECEALQGVVLHISEAHGLIPVHPSCSCCFMPANVGEKDIGQKRTVKEVKQALTQGGLGDVKVSPVRPLWLGGTPGSITDRESLGLNSNPDGCNQYKPCDSSADPASHIRSLYDRSGRDHKVMTLADIDSALQPLKTMDRAGLKEVLKRMELLGLGNKSRVQQVQAVRQKILDRRSSAQREAMMTGNPDADLELNKRREFFADCLRDDKGHCLPEGTAKIASAEQLAHARAVAREKARTVKKPTEEEKQEATKGIAELGANKYRRNLVGNTKNRRQRREALIAQFGDGKSKKCPCIYCGLKVGHGTMEQDKIITTAEGGRYRLDNLVPSCSSCNKKRGDTKWRSIKFPT